ncbi:AAA family ATPase [Kitasatospora griseola]|uniref:AAA family ATPase n=1 Tax=Kitasatospora griseola TaxID=2064 RepID=UPI00364EA7E1
MTGRSSTVVLMCGLPGAGKTTYAQDLVRRGFVRLSIDEVVWQRLGERDAGLALEADAYGRLKDEVRRIQRDELVELVRAGRDVVVDYSFWSRAARDDYKALVESHGGCWELIHLKADRATLERRLAVRNGEEGANAVTVNQKLFEPVRGRLRGTGRRGRTGLRAVRELRPGGRPARAARSRDAGRGGWVRGGGPATRGGGRCGG